MHVRLASIICLVQITIMPVFAEQADVNYDEAKIPSFTLPDPLILINGKQVDDPATWTAEHQPMEVKYALARWKLMRTLSAALQPVSS